MEVLVETQTEPLAEPFDVSVDPEREVFWKAADLIEEEGWLQHDLGGPGRGYCVLGAANQAEFGSVCSPGSAVGNSTWRRLIAAVGDPVLWNNRPERTKEEVVGVLRKLADS